MTQKSLTPMNPEIKEKWVTALESGNYEQGMDRLKGEDTFCCLGVLCDIYAKETGTKWADEQYNNQYMEGEDLELPKVVQEWAGLSRGNPHIDFSKDVYDNGVDGDVDTLAGLNDEKVSFKSIAKLIKEQY